MAGSSKGKNRKHTDAQRDEVVRLFDDEGVRVPMIARQTGLTEAIVRKIIDEHAVRENARVYRLPKFSGWDFSRDNLPERARA